MVLRATVLRWLLAPAAAMIACAGEVQLSAPPTDAAVDVPSAAPVDARDGAPADVPVDVPPDVDPMVTRGAAVFRRSCARCHGARGAGTGDGPDLRREVPASPDEEIRRVLVEGGRRMPAVPLDDGERADVFSFLRATFGAFQGP